MIPGEVLTPDGTIELGPGRERVTLTVENSGTGPAEGTKATTVTPGAFWLEMMLAATTQWPVNIVLRLAAR